MAPTSGSKKGRCMNFEGGKVCSCQLWKPLSDNAYHCDRCGCHMSFHKRANPNRSLTGRCLRFHGEGLSAGKDGCQEFFATPSCPSVCDGCKCHKNYHAQPEVVAGNVACVDSGDNSDCDSDGGDPILGDAAAERCNIFLCHAVAQRNFAADLRGDLARCGQRAFLGEGSIREISQKQFYKVIKQCGVVVVILSKEFFTESKWPMLELVAILREREKRCRKLRIVPVYYGATVNSCLDSKSESWKSNLEPWRREGGNQLTRIDSQKWSQAVETLRSVNGVVMGDGNLEEGFRKEVVEEVCRLFGSPKFDVSKIQGKSRLCKEVLDVVYPKQSPKDPRAGVRVVGLHGMAGSGKTSLCKVLCNMLFEEYDGKVCLAYVGSVGKGCSVGEVLRSVLNKLADVKPAVLDDVENFGGMAFQKYFKSEAVFERKAFLALENVTDLPPVMEVARGLKDAALAKGSVVLVTARSLDVLKGLGIEESDCMSMPDLLEEEAKSLFLDSAGLPVGARDGVDENLLKQFLKKCRFHKPGGRSFHYHPFALKLIGSNLPTGGYNPDLWKKKLDSIKDLRKDQGQIFELLRSSFDSLEEEDRLLFMDMAVFRRDPEPQPSRFAPVWKDEKWMLGILGPERLEELITVPNWLCMVHGKEPHECYAMMEGLVRKSFLEPFVVNGQHFFAMHDLVGEFSLHQTKIEPGVKRSWVYDTRNCNKLQGSDNVRSVCLGFDGWKSSKTINLNAFPNAGVMKLTDVVPDVTFRVDELEGLKSLEVIVKGFKGNKGNDDTEVPLGINLLRFGKECPDVPLRVNGLRLLHNLVFLRCSNVAYSACIDEIGDLRNLRVLDLVRYKGESLPNLSKLTKLEFLNLRECPSLLTIDLQNLPGLKYLDVDFTNFGKLDISGCMSLRKVWGLRRNECLQELILSRCQSLKELPSLQKCGRLRVLRMPDCRLIRSLRGLSGLKSLQMLDITGCEAMTELRGISGCVALKEFQASGCKNLVKLPILQDLQVQEIGPGTEMVEQETEDNEEEEVAGVYEFVAVGIGETLKIGVQQRGLFGPSDKGEDEQTIHAIGLQIVPQTKEDVTEEEMGVRAEFRA